VDRTEFIPTKPPNISSLRDSVKSVVGVGDRDGGGADGP
jgi:hypothetical protein